MGHLLKMAGVNNKSKGGPLGQGKSRLKLGSQPLVKQLLRASALSPDSAHARQLCAVAHERSRVARSVIDWSQARFTRAKRPLTKPLSDASCGLYLE